MGGDMEDLLLGDDDSSSGESDSEVAVKNSAAAAPVPPTVVPPPPAAAPAPQPTPAPAVPAPATQQAPQQRPPPTSSQSETAARLRSLYSPALNKKPATASAPTPMAPPPQQAIQGPIRSAPAPAPSSLPHTSPLRQASASQQPPPAPYHRTSSTSSAPPSQAPPHQQPQQQPTHHHQQQPLHAHRNTSSSSSGITHQTIPSSHRPSSSNGNSSRPPSSTQPAQPATSSYPPSSYARTGGGISQASSSGASRRVDPDPYAPTPVSQIQQQQQPPAQQQQVPVQRSASTSGYHQNHPIIVPPSSTSTPPVPSTGISIPPKITATMSHAEREREMKKYKERFLIFTRVLMKYLEQKDGALHQQVKAIIKDCAERNKRKEKGYESVTASMRTRLKQVVPEMYWKRAEGYLDHFLKEKAKQPRSGSVSSGVAPTNAPGSSTTTQQQQQQQQAEEQRRRQEEMRRLQLEKDKVAAAAAAAVAQRQQQVPPPVSAPAPAAPPAAPATKGKGKNLTNSSSHGRTTSPKGSGSKKTTKRSTGSKGAQQRKPSVSTPAASKTATPSETASATPATTQSQQQPAPPTTPTASTPAAAAVAATPTPVPPKPPPVREYNEFMELIEHAVDYDWTVAGLLMDKDQSDTLTSEQKALLEDTRVSKVSTAMDASKHKERKPTLPAESFPIPGWSQKNVLSARSSWALLRLQEEQAMRSASIGNDGMIPSLNNNFQPYVSTLSPEIAWYNEDKAEEDKVLAVLSEGLQIYLKNVLQKAVHSARQRHNVDGVRLWHQQTASVLKAKAAAKENSKKDKDSTPSKTSVASTSAPEIPNPPPLTLRLGCDVTRQVAQAAGNAAMTVKRMEEALDRQTDVASSDIFTAETEESTFLKARSMSDVAILPKLKTAVEKADYAGKRNFEIYGGKFSSQPPLGRIPKKPKLEIVDFQMGMNFTRRGKRRHRAGTMSSSFFF